VAVCMIWFVGMWGGVTVGTLLTQAMKRGHIHVNKPLQTF